MKNNTFTSPLKTMVKKTLFLLFVFACITLAFLSSVFTVSAFSATPQSEYDSYKIELMRLQADAKKSQLRHYWLDIAEDFYSLYEDNPKWVNRPAALFRAAESYDELAKRSYADKDRKQALKLYDKVIKEFPHSVLADDALYNSALVYSQQLRDSDEAEKRLKKILSHYKKADHADKAKAYLTNMDDTLTASLDLNLDTLSPSSYSTENTVLYKGLTASNKNDFIQIKVELDASKAKHNIVTWSLDFLPAQKETKSPARLILTLNHTRTEPEIRPGYKFKSMGIFSRFVVDYSKRNATVIMLDFKELSAYYAYYDKEKSTIIIETTNKKNVLSKGVKTEKVKYTERIPSDLLPRDFALQMGLKVRTIVIDAGHGGKDPGAIHNGITEKELTLSFAKQLGAKLKSLGYKVEYTRTADKFLTLKERTKLAEEKDGDLFISVHANAAESSKLAGLETYYLDYTRSPETQHIVDRENAGETYLGNMGNIVDDLVHSALMYESQRLAAKVHTTMYGLVSRKGFNSTNGGTKGSLFTVLQTATMPSILLEVGYVSNNLDAKNLRNKKFVTTLVEGVANGVDQYAKELNLVSKK